MGYAVTAVTGIAPARYNGNEIAEVGPADGTLGPDDVHFGVNLPVKAGGCPGFDALDDRFSYCPLPADQYGPRMFDVAVRGGTIAEDFWFRNSAHDIDTRLQAFLTFFDDFAKGRSINKVEFKAGTRRVVPRSFSTEFEVQEVGGLPKYRIGLGKKTKDTYDDKQQFGARWSKTALEMIIQGLFGDGKGKIHFHLDGMEDIRTLVEARTGDTDANVTSRELRYLKRNWSRSEVPGKVVFYNGYTDKYQAVVVKCPWAQA